MGGRQRRNGSSGRGPAGEACPGSNDLGGCCTAAAAMSRGLESQQGAVRTPQATAQQRCGRRRNHERSGSAAKEDLDSGWMQGKAVTQRHGQLRHRGRRRAPHPATERGTSEGRE